MNSKVEKWSEVKMGHATPTTYSSLRETLNLSTALEKMTAMKEQILDSLF